MPGELILLKSAGNLHLERLMLTFFTSIRCWEDVCGRKGHCPPTGETGCGLYGVPFDQHKTARKELAFPLPEITLAEPNRHAPRSVGNTIRGVVCGW